MTLFRLIAFVMLVVCAAGLHAAPGYFVDRVMALEDAERSLGPDQALAATNWQDLTATSLNKGYTRSAWWLLLELGAHETSDAVLEVRRAQLDDVRFYLPTNIVAEPGGERIGDWVRIQRGDRFARSEDDAASRGFSVRLNLPADKSNLVLLRIETSSSMLVSAELLSHEAQQSRTLRSLVLFGAAAGVILILQLISAVMYALQRERVYLHFFAVGGIGLAYIFVIEGFAPFFLDLAPPGFDKLTKVVVCAYIGGHALLAREVLQVQRFSWAGSAVLLAIFWLQVGLAIASVLDLSHFVMQYSLFLAATIPIMQPVFTIYLASRAWQLGIGPGPGMLLAFTILPVGHLPLMLTLLGWIPAKEVYFVIGQGATIVYLFALLPLVIKQAGLSRMQRAVLEQRIKQVNRDMQLQQRTNERQREWLSVVCHEIKTPLSVIDAVRQSLERAAQKRDDDFLAQRVESMQRATQRIDSLVNRLLSQRAAESRHMKARPEPIALRAFLEEAIPNLLPGKLGQIVLKVPTELKLQADPELLSISVGNLLTNAVVHGKPGRPIRVKARRNAEVIEIAVENDGEPIPVANRGRLFDQFFSPSGKGHGIGLWACRSIALAHGGDIRHEALLEGNRFVMSFPDIMPPPEFSRTSMEAAS